MCAVAISTSFTKPINFLFSLSPHARKEQTPMQTSSRLTPRIILYNSIKPQLSRKCSNTQELHFIFKLIDSHKILFIVTFKGLSIVIPSFHFKVQVRLIQCNFSATWKYFPKFFQFLIFNIKSTFACPNNILSLPLYIYIHPIHIWILQNYL